MAFSYTGGATNGGTGTSASVTHGLTINSGDLVVAYVNSNSTSTMSMNAGGSAWTEAIDELPSGESARQGLWWKIAGSSEPSSYTVTTGGSNWRIIVKVFSSTTDAVVDAAAVSAYNSTNSTSLVCSAPNGEVISDNAVSVVFGGKDNRATVSTYTTADNSYVGVVGAHANQDCAGCHRIYTTGTTFSGNLTISASSVNDKIYSVHMSFVEGSAGSVGSASGTSTALGVGASLAKSAGSSTGTSTSLGVGQSTSEASGQSSGVSTANGVGQALFQGVGSAAGTSTVNGVGQSSTGSVGSSSGTSTALGVGQSTHQSVGASAGTSTALGVGQGTAPGQAVGTSSGTSTAIAVGSSVVQAVGISIGGSTALARSVPLLTVGEEGGVVISSWSPGKMSSQMKRKLLEDDRVVMNFIEQFLRSNI